MDRLVKARLSKKDNNIVLCGACANQLAYIRPGDSVERALWVPRALHKYPRLGFAQKGHSAQKVGKLPKKSVRGTLSSHPQSTTNCPFQSPICVQLE